MRNFLSRFWLDAVVVAAFVAVSFAYFAPAVFNGKILYRHDSSAGRGAGREASEYYQRTGERTRWTNSTFSGMPTYQTAPSYDSTRPLDAAVSAYHLWLPDYVWYVFAYLLGFYILLRAFDFRQMMAALGAVVWAFSSYFFIIIAAGHIWKVMALAYLPPMIAGVVLAYRGKFLWGLVLTSVFTAFEVVANHVQMTYYYLIVVLAVVVAFLVEAVRTRAMARFAKATAVCALGAAIGVGMNISNLYHTWQYSQESMRSKSELVKADAANQTGSGLDRDYITQWSYGIGETWTLLIPNAKGGASVPLSENATAMEKADMRFADIYGQIGQYWGEQPGTSGPVYVGAFVLMLFVVGLFVVKGPMKWGLLAATILSVALSWGKNFMPLTDFFIDYVPMYAKFRTVASILVVAEFTIPLLALLALKKLLEDRSALAANMKYVYIGAAFTAGAALLFSVAPTLFFSDFISSAEMGALKGLPSDVAPQLMSNLREMREAMFTADCRRSALVVLIGTALILLYRYSKAWRSAVVAGMLVLCIVDMWGVNKRYLNDGMFVEKSVREAPIAKTPADEQILRDKDPNYRVLNMASNTFNENETSYHHKSIGGYHAAKLRRYQELIDAHISPEMAKAGQAIAKAGGDMSLVPGDSVWPVLNMLNAKYMVLPLQNGQTVPLQNPYAMGNAWFVDKVEYVGNANEEIAALSKLNLREIAVADKRFAAVLGNSQEQDASAYAKLTAYEPNKIGYKVESKTGGVLVFSEIYYPEWTATVDGKPTEVGRVNYVLRALKVGPGSHKVVLSFQPRSVEVTEWVAYGSYILLFAAVSVGIALSAARKKRARKENRGE